MHEAAVPSPSPLGPGQSIQIDVTYSGAIAQSAQRLLVIGTPNDVALRSDWDGISVPFTGLRGFGNVVWYPVSSVPVILGDGNRLFDEMGEHKLRMAGAQFRLRLTVEFPHGMAPIGSNYQRPSRPSTVTSVDTVGQEINGVATALVEHSILGFEAPSLFVAARAAHAATNTTLWTLPIDEPAVQSWSAAAAAVTPFLQSWLGQRPRSQLTVLDLPDPEDTPFETGAMLATSIREAPPEQLQNILAHALTHAWMQSPRAWLSEGVAHFMGTLWIEKQRGRTRALQVLEDSSGRTGACRTLQSRNQHGPAACPRHSSHLLPHQGHIRLLDAPRPGRRRCSLRGPSRSTIRPPIQALVIYTTRGPANSKSSWSRQATVAILPGFSPIGSTPTKDCPTSPSTASFPLPSRRGTGWSP